MKRTKKKSAKPEILSEAKIEQAYEIAVGFNIPDGDAGKEKRFDVGKRKAQFVFEKDFEPDVFKALLKMDAIVPVVTLDEVLDEELTGDVVNIETE